jgi:hypothetical protein
MKTIKIQFNKDFLEFKKNQKKIIQCDSNKTPIELRFRKLLKDSEIDNTVSVVISEKKMKKSKLTKSTQSNESENNV